VTPKPAPRIGRAGPALAVAVVVAACAAPGPPLKAPTGTPEPIPAQSATAPSNGIGLSVTRLLGANLGSPPSATTWIRAADPTVSFSYEVPASWSHVAAAPFEEGGATVGMVLAAGPDPTKLGTDFSVPGVAVGLSTNPRGTTARAAVEAEDYAAACKAGGIQDGDDPAAAYQSWDSCGPGDGGTLLVIAVTPETGGLVLVVFQGSAAADLAYLDHILGSLAGTSSAASPPPGATSGPLESGGPFSITLDICQNQHGQGVAEGLIRNNDALVHAFRVYVTFFDPNGILLTDTDGLTPDIPPGVTAKWQAVVPSGLPSTSVTCQVTDVKVVR
jgi:hypothetical protein